MKITYLGHSAVLIEGSKTVLIDPFLVDNPKAAMKPEQVPHVDIILTTHDHFDHFGQALDIAKRDGATLVAIHEVATQEKVASSKINAVGMNIGGTYVHDGVKISMTQAVHSASMGSPCGFVIEMDGARVYHSGDTALFSDMTLVPSLFGPLDVALLPIGGHYVMDVKQAVLAVELLDPKVVIPIHYNTWPVINADPGAFKVGCGTRSVEVLNPGESFSL